VIDLAGLGAAGAVRERLAGRPQGTFWVRVAGGEQGFAQARAVACEAVAGILVSRAGSATELAALGSVLAEAEEACGLPVGSVAVIPVLATAAAVLGAADIARAPRVRRLQLDEDALRAELRLESTEDERELLWARSMTVLASAAAAVLRPVGSLSTEDDGFRRSTRELRRLGFYGRACMDPQQVTVANEVFTVSDGEVVV
jgi:citrate lyase subunit beta/citryl-CoA lyase